MCIHNQYESRMSTAYQMNVRERGVNHTHTQFKFDNKIFQILATSDHLHVKRLIETDSSCSFIVACKIGKWLKKDTASKLERLINRPQHLFTAGKNQQLYLQHHTVHEFYQITPEGVRKKPYQFV